MRRTKKENAWPDRACVRQEKQPGLVDMLCFIHILFTLVDPLCSQTWLGRDRRLLWMHPDALGICPWERWRCRSSSKKWVVNHCFTSNKSDSPLISYSLPPPLFRNNLVEYFVHKTQLFKTTVCKDWWITYIIPNQNFTRLCNYIFNWTWVKYKLDYFISYCGIFFFHSRLTGVEMSIIPKF